MESKFTLKQNAEAALAAYLRAELWDMPTAQVITGVTVVTRQHETGVDVYITGVQTGDNPPLT